MRNTLSLLPLKTQIGEGNSSFNVVIVYEDLETGKQGKKTYDFLAENLGKECQFNHQMWKFDVLSVPKLRDIAAKDAAAADIIIVSTHGKNDLPNEVKAWLNWWVLQPKRTIAMVALFDKEDYRDNPCRSYLAGVAKLAHIDFFSQPGIWPRGEQLSVNSWPQTSQGRSTLVGSAPHDRHISHWGINE